VTTREEATAFYEDFAVLTGLRDWMHVNPRHEQLKLLVDEVLAGRRGLRILDVGCGGGVLTSHLCRYGEVTGIDFSRPAVEAARRLVPAARFEVASLENLRPGEPFDVIAMFDVLEHIPAAERPAFLADVRANLAADGLVVASTPFPAFTRHKRELGDDALQVIDEEVELPQLLHEAAAVGLQLVRFQTYDVFAGTPEYQLAVFAPEGVPGTSSWRRSPELERRMRRYAGPRRRRARRLALAARAGLRRDRGLARWFLRGTAPSVRS